MQKNYRINTFTLQKAQAKKTRHTRKCVNYVNDQCVLCYKGKIAIKKEVTEQGFNIDQTTGLRTNKIVVMVVAKSKKLYPAKLRLVEYYNAEKDLLFFF